MSFRRPVRIPYESETVLDTLTGLSNELFIDEVSKEIRVMDGITPGGITRIPTKKSLTQSGDGMKHSQTMTDIVVANGENRLLIQPFSFDRLTINGSGRLKLI